MLLNVNLTKKQITMTYKKQLWRNGKEPENQIFYSFFKWHTFFFLKTELESPCLEELNTI